MAISIESYSSGGVADGADASFSLSAPSGTVSGDLLILIMAWATSRTANTPSGFTPITGAVDTATGEGIKAFYRIANGTETSWTVGCNIGYGFPSAICVRITDGTDSFVASAAHASTWSAITCADVVTAENDSLVLWAGSKEVGAGAIAAFGSTTPLTEVHAATYQSLVVTSTAAGTAGNVTGPASATEASPWSALSLAIAPLTGTPTTTTLTSSANPTYAGTSVTLTATISESAATGTVQFKSNGSDIGSPATVTDGVATLSYSWSSADTYSVTAVYSGDGTYSGSTSNTVSEVVNTVPAGYTSSGSGNWNDSTKWTGTGGQYPGYDAGDVATVQAGHVMTITATPPNALGSNASGLGPAITIQGSAGNPGEVIVNSGVTLTLQGYDTTTNPLALVNRYGKFSPQPGSIIVGDVAGDYSSIIVNKGIITATGTSGSHITFKQPDANIRWNNSVSAESQSVLVYNPTTSIGCVRLDNDWLCNAAGTAPGTMADQNSGSGGGSGSAVTVGTNASFCSAPKASLAAIASSGDYWIDFDRGIIYFYWGYSGAPTLTVTYNYADFGAPPKGWGIDTSQSTTYNSASFTYCDFLHMGPVTGGTGKRVLNAANRITTGGGGTSQGFGLSHCTFTRCYHAVELASCTGSAGDPVLIDSCTFNSCRGDDGTLYGNLIRCYGTSTYVTISNNVLNCRSDFVRWRNVSGTATVNTGTVISGNTGNAMVLFKAEPEGNTFPDGVYSGNTISGSAGDARPLGFAGTSGHPTLIHGNSFASIGRAWFISSHQRFYENAVYFCTHHGLASDVMDDHQITDVRIYNNLFFGEDKTALRTASAPVMYPDASICFGYNHNQWIDDVVAVNNTVAGPTNGYIEFCDTQDDNFVTLVSRAIVVNNGWEATLSTYTTSAKKLADTTTKRGRAHVIQWDYNGDYNAATRYTNLTTQGTFTKGGTNYNAIAPGGRSVPGIALFNPSFSTKTGGSLALSYTNTTTMTLAWGSGSPVSMVLDSGTATGGAVNTDSGTGIEIGNVLTDSGKTWPTAKNDSGTPAGNWLKITGGAGSGQWAAITSNTATTLTTCPKMATTPDSSSTYTIIKSEIALVDGSESLTAGVYLPDFWASGSTPSTGTDTAISFADHSVTGSDPLLSSPLSASASGYHIGILSPWNNVGTSANAPTTDYLGASRLSYDIGFYEQPITIIDNAAAIFAGTWPAYTAAPKHDTNYQQHAGSGTGTNTATWEFTGLTASASYFLGLGGHWDATYGATNTPWEILDSDGTTVLASGTFAQNAQYAGVSIDGIYFQFLGLVTATGTSLSIRISDDCDNYAFADAAILQPSTETMTYGSVQDGNASSTSTWSPSISDHPTTGDLVAINHNVTVDDDMTWGTSGATGTAAVTLTGNKTLTIAAGKTLTVLGDYNATGGATAATPHSTVLAAGAKLILKPPSSAARYLLNLSNAQLVCNGSSGAHCEVKTDTSDGGLVGYVPLPPDYRDSGLITATYTDFTDLGTTTQPGIYTKISAALDQDVSITNCTFTRSNYSFVQSYGPSDGDFIFQGNKFASSVLLTTTGVSSPAIFTWVTDRTSGTRMIDLCAFDGSISGSAMRQCQVTNCLIQGIYAPGTSWGSWPDDSYFANNVMVADVGDTPFLSHPPGSVKDTYLCSTLSAGNPHFMSAQDGNVDWSATGMLFHTTSVHGDGDCIFSPAYDAGTPTTTVTKCIVLPNASGNTSGKLVNIEGSSGANPTGPCIVKITADHNTYCGTYNSDGHGLIAMDESLYGGANASYPDAVVSCRGNLVWGESANDVWCIRSYPRTPSSTDAVGVPTTGIYGANHNGFWNASTGTVNGGAITSVVGYDRINISGTYPSNQLGTDDVNLNASGGPDFVDSTRNLLTWGAATQSTDGSLAQAVAALAADPSLITSMIAWVRAGFQPQNTLLRGTAHDATDIGAVAMAATSSIVPLIIMTGRVA